ncbi:MAG: DNA-directed RNA polymerase subunit L [Candidatus Methanoplasma sp.]|jgi:DNA-directed RNA polymerase subunit L|nr:DNA-directed RNA polymerase subunit L [Candidatus Methanoplasma sp.]
MMTYVAEQSGDSLTLGFKDANLPLIDSLVQVLNGDSAVSVARIVDSHPELCDLTLHVRVKSGEPMDAVKRASREIAEYFSSNSI